MEKDLRFQNTVISQNFLLSDEKLEYSSKEKS